MRLHRFIQKGIVLDGTTVTIDDVTLLHQIASVLRLAVGSRAIFCDGIDTEAEVEITELSKSRLTGTIVSTKKDSSQKPTVSLYISIPKKDILERVVQMATEIGVREIVPMVCERTVKVGLHKERLEKIAGEAVELSGRFCLPDIADSLVFEKALQRAQSQNTTLILCDSSGATTFQNIETGEVAIFIGPEGGFTEKEIIVAKNHGAHIQSFGIETLRIETAAIKALILFQAKK